MIGPLLVGADEQHVRSGSAVIGRSWAQSVMGCPSRSRKGSGPWPAAGTLARVTTEEPSSVDFVRAKIIEDNASGRFGGRVQTRFPPEPNGYLHIGHAKSIGLNFSLADEFDGVCNLRFDDTNPDTEDQEFIDAIQADLAWLGYEPADVLYASDYFAQLYAWAEELITKGLAYVDDSDAETISEQRGGFGKPGIESPYRDRTPEENLGLFRQMRDGAFADGEKVLRAKIDMQSENMQLRDPVLYRIRRFGPSSDRGQRVDHLPDLRLGPRSVRRHRGRHPFDLHPRVRRPPPALRLVPRPTSTSRNDRPEQTEFARLALTHTMHLEAEAGPAGGRRPRRRLGRPPHADRSAGFDVGAIPPARSGPSPTTSGWPRPTRRSTSSCSSRSSVPS